MPAIHVRDLDDAVIAALKARAAAHRRSLQGEVRTILEDAVAASSRSTHRGPRKLRLHIVRVGRPARYSREAIYRDEDQ